jgi:hypothetical protein
MNSLRKLTKRAAHSHGRAALIFSDDGDHDLDILKALPNRSQFTRERL